MDDYNGKREPVFLTPPQRIDLVVGADATGMAGANLLDNYDLEENLDDDQYTLSDKIVHCIGGQIFPVHWNAVKIVLVFKAGCEVSAMHTMTKACMQSHCLEKYVNLISHLDPLYFSKASQAFFLSSMRSKDFPMTGDSILRNFGDYRKKMRSLIIPVVGSTFVTMKSGKGFHETCNDFIVTVFRRDISKGTPTKPGIPWTEAEQMLPPANWEYKKVPWVCFLCVKIFCKHIQLAPDVAAVMNDISNKTESREIIKRKAREAVALEDYSRKMLPPTRTPVISNKTKIVSIPIKKEEKEDNRRVRIKKEKGVAGRNNGVGKKAHSAHLECDLAKNRKHVVWSKVHMAKAMEQSANANSKLAELDAIEKSLSLLDKMRKVMGEVAYVAHVRDLATSMPDTSSFVRDCEVICIGDDNDVISIHDTDDDEDPFELEDSAPVDDDGEMNSSFLADDED